MPFCAINPFHSIFLTIRVDSVGINSSVRNMLICCKTREILDVSGGMIEYFSLSSHSTINQLEKM